MQEHLSDSNWQFGSRALLIPTSVDSKFFKLSTSFNTNLLSVHLYVYVCLLINYIQILLSTYMLKISKFELHSYLFR